MRQSLPTHLPTLLRLTKHPSMQTNSLHVSAYQRLFHGTAPYLCPPAWQSQSRAGKCPPRPGCRTGQKSPYAAPQYLGKTRTFRPDSAKDHVKH